MNFAGYGKYDFPVTKEGNGQSFLCISLKTNESAEKVGNQVNLLIASLDFYWVVVKELKISCTNYVKNW